MSMPPEEFYGKAESQSRGGENTRSLMIAHMTSVLVFLRTGFIGAFIAIAVIHLLGPQFGLAGNGYDVGGLVVGFGLGTVIEIVRRNRAGRSKDATADPS